MGSHTVMVLAEIKYLPILNASKSCPMTTVWTPLELMELLNSFVATVWVATKRGFMKLRYLMSNIS